MVMEAIVSRSVRRGLRIYDDPDDPRGVVPLARMLVPTLLIGGEKDKGAPPEILAEAAAAIPNCRHDVIARAGHISNIENPEDFNVALTAFLAELSVAA